MTSIGISGVALISMAIFFICLAALGATFSVRPQQMVESQEPPVVSDPRNPYAPSLIRTQPARRRKLAVLFAVSTVVAVAAVSAAFAYFISVTSMVKNAPVSNPPAPPIVVQPQLAPQSEFPKPSE